MCFFKIKSTLFFNHPRKTPVLLIATALPQTSLIRLTCAISVFRMSAQTLGQRDWVTKDIYQFDKDVSPEVTALIIACLSRVYLILWTLRNDGGRRLQRKPHLKK